MKIGIPKEIKKQENRVGLTPESVAELKKYGHEIFLETNAGQGINASDDVYRKNGATILKTPEEIFDVAEMIVKVKEPQPSERKLLKEKHILFTYLHLAPDPEQAKDLINSGATCIAYETVTNEKKQTPLLMPMSEVAGRLATQVGAYHMLKHFNGSGKLIGGVPGVEAADVTIIGGGVVGLNAAKVAIGMGANVTILDNNVDVLRFYDNTYGSAIKTLYSNSQHIYNSVINSDLIISGVYIKGAKAPKLITKDMLPQMRPGTVMVDVSIDQGGCFETSKATTHAEPTYVIDNVVHYCVANMPGSVPLTSTYALNNATIKFALQLANQGLEGIRQNPHLMNGLNVHRGHITDEAVAKQLGYSYKDPKTFV